MVIVTGSTGGIGSAIVEAFNRNGSQVFGIDKHNCDLTDYESIKTVMRKMERPVSVLVNCAGVSLDEETPDYWDTTFAVNVRAPYLLSNLVKERMVNGGAIVNITSLNAEQGFRGNPAYVASKHALSGLTKAMAYDFAPYGIRVNSVCPGYIKTAMTEKSYSNPIARYERAGRTMLERWGTPEDVAWAVLFLASPEASYITGTSLNVDGGWLSKGL